MHYCPLVARFVLAALVAVERSRACFFSVSRLHASIAVSHVYSTPCTCQRLHMSCTHSFMDSPHPLPVSRAFKSGFFRPRRSLPSSRFASGRPAALLLVSLSLFCVLFASLVIPYVPSCLVVFVRCVFALPSYIRVHFARESPARCIVSLTQSHLSTRTMSTTTRMLVTRLRADVVLSVCSVFLKWRRTSARGRASTASRSRHDTTSGRTTASQFERHASRLHHPVNGQATA
jgi:hypothetical protein